MLHNNGGFGPSENPSNTNLSEKTPKISTPSNVGHNMGNLSEIAPQQLRTTSERYDIPIHSSYNYELSSYNANLGTFSAYQNRRLPDVFDPNNTRCHDPNWPNTLATHMHSVPFQNMPHYLPPFEVPRVSPDYRNQSLPNNHISDHRNMDNYHMYNRNKDNFSHFNQSFGPTQQPYKMDSNKQKKLENTVKLIENIIINSSNHEINPPITNEKPINLGKSDNQDKILATDLLGGQMQNSHLKQSLEIENRNKEIEEMSSNHKHEHIVEVEQLENNKTSHLFNALTKNKNSKTETDNNLIIKDKLQKCDGLIQVEHNKSDNSKTDSNLPETNENKQLAKAVSTNNEPVTKLQNQNEEDINEEITNENEVALSAETELQVEVDKVYEVEINIPDDVNDSTTQEHDYSKIFLRDSNKLSPEDVKKGNIVNFATSVEEATASIKNGTSATDSFYECQYCNYYFQHPKRFLIHVKWHTFGLANEKRKEMARQQQLEKQPPKKPKLQQCELCEKKFKTLNSLTNHKQRFHSSEQLECPDCGVTVAGVLDLRAHQNAQHQKPWVCKTCHRQCSNKYTLAKHMRTHLEKHLSCSQCDKLFATETQLKDHSRVHERIARGAIYKCSYCDKSFYQTYNLQAHEKTHSNEKPFSCEICNTKFATNSSLKRHLKVSHNSEKPYACPECNRCFAEQRTLVGHMSKSHPGSGVVGTKAAKKSSTKSGARKGKKGKKSKKADDASDTQDSDFNADYM